MDEKEVSEVKKFIVIIFVLYMLAGVALAYSVSHIYSTTPGGMLEKVLAVIGALGMIGIYATVPIEITSSGLLLVVRDVMCREEDHRREAGGG